jgi:ferredoxin
VLRHRARTRAGHTRGWGGLVSEVLRVNPIACTGRGVCAELLPEFIAMDPWGYPIVPRAELDDELLDLARKAVAACPVLALTLQKR